MEITFTENQPLAPLTTIRVGGPAEYFATVTRVEQLIRLTRWARSVDVPYFLLGGGSNMLISDAGIQGLVIHNRCRQVRLDPAPCCDPPGDERPYLYAESGAAMAGVARRSIQAGLSGLEWGVSVPGTIGGAVVGNAGAHGSEIKDALWNTLLLDEEGDVQEYRSSDFAYGYRDSAIKRLQPVRAGFKPVILSANFRLHPGQPSLIQERAGAYLQHRRRTQPAQASLGSTFMNPPQGHAGHLIEAAGLKGTKVGGVEVSRVHANFIVNPGGVGAARAQDVRTLMSLVQKVVQERFGVLLVPEVMLVGEWDE